MMNNTNPQRGATDYMATRHTRSVADFHRHRVAMAAKAGMFTERTVITPEHAAYIIENHAPKHTNRTLSSTVVATLTAHMDAGRWNPNSHQGIAFRDDGTLGDGQHRLWACIKSGKPFTTLVTYGQPADVFDILDRGMQRTGAHILQSAGLDVVNLNNAAAAARFLLILLRSGAQPFADNARSFDKAELVPFMREHQAAVGAAVRDARRITKAIARKVPVTGLAAPLFLIGRSAEPARIEMFVDALAHGAGLDIDNPILAMRNAIIADSAAQGYRGNDERSRALAAAVINTWNLWTARRRIKSFKPISYKRGEPFPEPRA